MFFPFLRRARARALAACDFANLFTERSFPAEFAFQRERERFLRLMVAIFGVEGLVFELISRYTV